MKSGAFGITVVFEVRRELGSFGKAEPYRTGRRQSRRELPIASTDSHKFEAALSFASNLFNRLQMQLLDLESPPSVRKETI